MTTLDLISLSFVVLFVFSLIIFMACTFYYEKGIEEGIWRTGYKDAEIDKLNKEIKRLESIIKEL